MKLAYAPQAVPTVVAALKSAGAKVTKVAAGHNHVVCVDAAGKCYTWGNGGYGRLGHKEQKDEFLPKQARRVELHALLLWHAADCRRVSGAGLHPGRRAQRVPRGLRCGGGACVRACEGLGAHQPDARARHRARRRPSSLRRRARSTTGERRERMRPRRTSYVPSL